MPESAPAPTSGKSWPNNESPTCGAPIMVLLTILLAIAAPGCDDEEEDDDRIPTRHAEVRAVYHAEMTVAVAREWTLLHPQSDRQRQAREQLLFLEELEHPIPEPSSDDFGGFPELQNHLEQVQDLGEATRPDQPRPIPGHSSEEDP